MAEKKALTDEELMAQFADIPAEDAGVHDKKGTAANAAGAEPASVDADDVLAELQNLAAARPASRPETPKLSNTNRNAPRTSEDQVKHSTLSRELFEGALGRSEESASASEPSKAPQAASDPHREQSGGSWWGGIFATASAAVKQAETAVKEIQKNEEAQRWAEQVKGNVGALRGLGGHDS